MKPVQTVLMIDDDIDDQEIFREVLHEIDPLIICLQPSSAKHALSLLLEDNQRPDVIFLAARGELKRCILRPELN